MADIVKRTPKRHQMTKKVVKRDKQARGSVPRSGMKHPLFPNMKKKAKDLL